MTRALLLIDIQTGFDHPIWGARNNPGAEARARDLLTHARAQDWAIYHIRHVSVEMGSPLSGSGTAFKAEVTPISGEPILEKSVNSAFIGTDLERRLRQAGTGELTLCGLTTPHCASTTTRMAANLGFNVTLAHDACAAFSGNADASWYDGPAMNPEQIHISALNHLHGEFANIQATGDIIAMT